MTRKEAIRRAKEKYIELWGEEWVRENADHICGSLDTLANYMCEIAIVESTPRPLEYSPVRGTENLDGRGFKFKAEPQNGLSV